MKTHSRSISHDIVLKSGLAVALVLVVTALLANWLISRQLQQSFDQTMTAKAQILVFQVKEYADEVDFDFADEFMPEYERETNPEYFQFWTDDVGVYERSNSLLDRDLPRVAMEEGGVLIRDITLPNGRNGRSVQIYFAPQIEDIEQRTAERLRDQKWMTLVIAKERESLDTQLISVATIIFSGVVAITSIVLILIRRSVRSGLKPLLALQNAVSRTNIDNLDDTVDIGDPPEELEPLVEQLNSMAHRISHSVQRERRFSADVAHELKTPIAELLSMAEVSIRWPERVDDNASFFHDVLDSSTVMQNIVTKLLMLSRCENGQIVLEPEALSITDVLEALRKRLDSSAKERQIELITQIDKDFSFETSRVEFELILQNLLGNAIQYSPVGGQVLLKVWASGTSGHITITNYAPELEAQDVGVMFDRLWRKDESRSGHLNAGLGLTLVSAYASLLAIDVTTNLEDDRMFTVHLSNLDVV